MDYLTEIEKDKIKAFNKDEVMVEAIKKVLFESIYEQGVVKKGEVFSPINGAFHIISNAYAQGNAVSDEMIGQNVRAKFESVNQIMNAFTKLKTIKDEDGLVESPLNNAI